VGKKKRERPERATVERGHRQGYRLGVVHGVLLTILVAAVIGWIVVTSMCSAATSDRVTAGVTCAGSKTTKPPSTSGVS
jgi:hypothetical protein